MLVAGCAAAAGSDGGVDEDEGLAALDSTASAVSEEAVASSPAIAVLFPGAKGGALACGSDTWSFDLTDMSTTGYRIRRNGVAAPDGVSCNFQIVHSYATVLACIADPTTGATNLFAANYIDYWFEWQPQPATLACVSSPIVPALYSAPGTLLNGTVKTIGQNAFVVASTGIWSFGADAQAPHGSILQRNGHGDGALGVYNASVETAAVRLALGKAGLLYSEIDTGDKYDYVPVPTFHNALAWVPLN